MSAIIDPATFFAPIHCDWISVRMRRRDWKWGKKRLWMCKTCSVMRLVVHQPPCPLDESRADRATSAKTEAKP